MEEVCPKHTLQKIQDRLFKKDKELKKKRKKKIRNGIKKMQKSFQ